MMEVVILICGLPLDHAVGFEAREDEGSTNSSSGTPCCRPSEIAIGEAVHQAAEGGAFLVHVDEDLAQRAVVVFRRCARRWCGPPILAFCV